jgi:hypothetical protein
LSVFLVNAFYAERKKNNHVMNEFPINGITNLKIKRCSNCGKQFVSRTERCPFCKTSHIRRYISLKGISIIIVVVFISVFVSDFFIENSKDKDHSTNQDIINQKEDRVTSDFLGSVELHYTQLVDNYKAGNFNLAIKELNLFKKYNRIDYKDVGRIKKDLIAHLDQMVRNIPVSETIENLTMYQQLLELEPGNARYKNKVKFYMNRYNNANSEDNKK